jgi:hypothetical protein
MVLKALISLRFEEDQSERRVREKPHSAVSRRTSLDEKPASGAAFRAKLLEVISKTRTRLRQKGPTGDERRVESVESTQLIYAKTLSRFSCSSLQAMQRFATGRAMRRLI